MNDDEFTPRELFREAYYADGWELFMTDGAPEPIEVNTCDLDFAESYAKLYQTAKVFATELHRFLNHYGKVYG